MSVADIAFSFSDEDWSAIEASFPVEPYGGWAFEDDDGVEHMFGVRLRLELAVTQTLFMQGLDGRLATQPARAAGIATAAASLLRTLGDDDDPLGRAAPLDDAERAALIAMLDRLAYAPAAANPKRRRGPNNSRRDALIRAVAKVWEEQFGNAAARETGGQSKRTFVAKALKPVLGEELSYETLRKVLP